jgi:Family of unknown function (DUF5924)/Protein of unknown function (DUF2914)
LTEVAFEERPLAPCIAGALALGRRWGISFASLVGGCFTLFVFRRGLPAVGWIIGYLLVVWLLFVLLRILRRPPIQGLGVHLDAAPEAGPPTDAEAGLPADSEASPGIDAEAGPRIDAEAGRGIDAKDGPSPLSPRTTADRSPRRPLRAYLTRRQPLVIAATDYTIQSLCHGLLLFVLPAYYASATLASVNVVFVVLLVVLAVLTTVDPWFRAVVGPRPWLGYGVFGVSTFAALAVALPLIGVPPYLALLASAGLSIVALAPAVLRERGWRWRSALPASALLALVAVASGDLLRAWIPPAPLMLARSTLAWSVSELEPVGPLGTHVQAADLRQAGSIVAYTAIYAPPALSQAIVHVWRHEGDIVGVVPLSPVKGGRSAGFRTFSRKTAPADPVGRWSVDVLTPSGQLVGRIRFTVTE